MAALDDSPRLGKARVITPEARLFLIDLARRKPGDFGYPHELWTTRLLADHAREHGPRECHPSLSTLVQGTPCKILNAHHLKPRKTLADSTRRQYRQRLDRDLDTIMTLNPSNPRGRRLRKRHGKIRGDLSTVLVHPEAPPDNNGSERESRPTATYRKVTGGFRSDWGADLFASVRSVIGTAARKGIDAHAAILDTLRAQPVLNPG